MLPAWPGADAFPGELLHSSAYANPEPYRGRDVLVVGAGNTGAEIAADLADGGAASVRLAVRTPPNVIRRELGPVPMTLLGISLDFTPAWLADPLNGFLQRRFVGDLTRYGLPAARQGVVAQQRATGVTPTIDVGLIEALKAGRVTPVAALERFDGRDVVLADGTRLQPDVVIAATGCSTGLRPVVGHLGVLDDRGRPARAGRPDRGIGAGAALRRAVQPAEGAALPDQPGRPGRGAGDRPGAAPELTAAAREHGPGAGI